MTDRSGVRTDTAPPASVRLSPLEFTACWQALDLDQAPPALTGSGAGRGFDRPRRQLALAALGGRQLADSGRPRADLAAALRLLAEPEYELDLRYSGPQGQILGVGAVAGDRGVAVLTSEDDEQLDLAPMDAARLAPALLERLGSTHAGTGRTVHVPADALDAATRAADSGNPRELADRLEQHGVPRLEASSLVRMCEGMWCRGQLGATAHFGGPGRRAPWVIGFHATDAGWFVQLRRDGTVTICPSDASGLLHHWRTLVDHVRPVT
ncbi:MAG TPA: ESX secretion-associated protein EspG [Pseudonocardia sp.]|nr:ESX secretion-associated protein EspG [Pseudonocardia sp.]